MTQRWALGNGREVVLDRPRLLGVLNTTPDSFHAASRVDAGRALDAARAMVGAGADALDVGGESTRPGAPPVPEDEQIARVVPVVRALRAAEAPLRHVPVSIDTTRVPVARAALDAGADAINDVSGASDDPGMLALAASSGAGLVLMHRLRPPAADVFSDRYSVPPEYGPVAVAGAAGESGGESGGVVAHVRAFLAARLRAALDAGVAPERILLDPGLGFGKSVEQNLDLLRATPELLALGRPVLSALSRKSFVGRVGLARDSDPAERLPATLALSLLHLHAGARLFRVHDVAEHAQALRAAWACLSAPGGPQGAGPAEPRSPRAAG
jgi:dihydropteroate synthase